MLCSFLSYFSVLSEIKSIYYCVFYFALERTIKMYRDIGPAVWNGGFSTFLAIVPLATSQSHVFVTFFRVRIMINGKFIYWENDTLN